MLRRAFLAAWVVAALVLGGTAQAALFYENGFETGAEADDVIPYGGIVAWAASGTDGIPSSSGGYHVQVDVVDDGGAYTYGPGKTQLAPGFGTFRQSVDVYVDPDLSTHEELTWTCEVLLRSNTNSDYWGEFDFFGRKKVFNAGQQDEYAEYTLGRNSAYGGLPWYFVVEEPGWFTFTSEWTDDGTQLANHNTISQDGQVLFQGDSVNSPYPSDPLGYETGYMWFFGRNDSSLTLGLDNLEYEEIPPPAPVPEPSAYLIWGLGLLGVIGWRRRKEA